MTTVTHPPSSEPVAETGTSRRSFLKWTGAAGAAIGIGGATEAWSQAPGAVAPTLATNGGPITLTAQQRASRFVAQATFGGDLAMINQVNNMGLESWLDAQMALAHTPILEDHSAFVAQFGEEDIANYFDWAWWNRAMLAPDVVRQRVAFSLSQIFVVSRRLDLLYDLGDAIASYHDIFLRNAFGNFRDILFDVTMHPVMGFYLSHLNNRRSDASINRFPDENYAREVMQLFSIGLVELNPDGTPVLAPEAVPTYTNAEITEFAKIFTGLTLSPYDPDDPVIFGTDEGDWLEPMVMVEAEHEPGPKNLLNGFVVPGGQTGMQDINMAIDNLFNHPNVGPFIGRLMIQRLVTSNPSPAYVGRVAAAFADNGFGVRGDMKALWKAILLDPEARDTNNIGDPNFGKVREPFTKWVHVGRAFHATSNSGQFRHFGGAEPGDDDVENDNVALAQYPYFAPSVFNFYLPDHSPAGPLTTAGLVAPEMEIVHAFTSIATINLMNRAVIFEHYIYDAPADEDVRLNLATEEAIAQTGPSALVDHLDLLLTYGTLSASSRQIILDAITPLAADPYDQVIMALYLFLISPEYAVQR
ncbi:MAG: DUF1800 family protein [Acidobacteriota bacterium]